MRTLPHQDLSPVSFIFHSNSLYTNKIEWEEGTDLIRYIIILKYSDQKTLSIFIILRYLLDILRLVRRGNAQRNKIGLEV